MRPWGMFTAEGTAAVEAIVRSSKNSAEALTRLELLHQAGVHKEATDTDVREHVWAYKRDQGYLWTWSSTKPTTLFAWNHCWTLDEVKAQVREHFVHKVKNCFT